MALTGPSPQSVDRRRPVGNYKAGALFHLMRRQGSAFRASVEPHGQRHRQQQGADEAEATIGHQAGFAAHDARHRAKCLLPRGGRFGAARDQLLCQRVQPLAAGELFVFPSPRPLG